MVLPHVEKEKVIGIMVCLSVVYGFFDLNFFKIASAQSSPAKARSSSSVLKAVSSHSVARSADLMFAASRSFGERSTYISILVLTTVD